MCRLQLARGGYLDGSGSALVALPGLGNWISGSRNQVATLLCCRAPSSMWATICFHTCSWISACVHSLAGFPFEPLVHQSEMSTDRNRTACLSRSSPGIR
jgi:hypothetical protein